MKQRQQTHTYMPTCRKKFIFTLTSVRLHSTNFEYIAQLEICKRAREFQEIENKTLQYLDLNRKKEEENLFYSSFRQKEKPIGFGK